MSLPKFCPGDSFILDNIVHNVTSYIPHLDAFWCSSISAHNIPIDFVLDYNTLQWAHRNNRLTAWVLEERWPQNTHTHEWKIYRGLNVVEKHCDCGEKKNVDWKELS